MPLALHRLKSTVDPARVSSTAFTEGRCARRIDRTRLHSLVIAMPCVGMWYVCPDSCGGASACAPPSHWPHTVRSWFRVQGSGFRVQGSGFRVQGSGFRVRLPALRRNVDCTRWVRGSGFRIQGSGSRVQGSGFSSQGSGFRVQGSGCVSLRSADALTAPASTALSMLFQALVCGMSARTGQGYLAHKKQPPPLGPP